MRVTQRVTQRAVKEIKSNMTPDNTISNPNNGTTVFSRMVTYNCRSARKSFDSYMHIGLPVAFRGLGTGKLKKRGRGAWASYRVLFCSRAPDYS